MKLQDLLDRIKAGEEQLFTEPSLTLQEDVPIDFHALVSNAFDTAITVLLTRSSTDNTDERTKVLMICDFLANHLHSIIGNVHAATLNKYPKRGIPHKRRGRIN